MATKKGWEGSVLLSFFFFFSFSFFFRASADENATLSLDVTTPVTKQLATEKDGEETTIGLVMTTLPSDVNYTNETNDITVTTTMHPGDFDDDQNQTSVRMKTTTASPTTNLTTKPPRPNDPDNTVAKEETEWDERWDEPFKYDYSSRRQAGLIIAAVLFVLGILVITCGKIRCSRRCHLSKGRSYEVTRM